MWEGTLKFGLKMRQRWSFEAISTRACTHRIGSEVLEGLVCGYSGVGIVGVKKLVPCGCQGIGCVGVWLSGVWGCGTMSELEPSNWKRRRVGSTRE